MADHEITDDTVGDIYAGIDLNEVKTLTFRDFLEAMRRSGSVAVIKFWSLLSQMEDEDLREGAKLLIAAITNDQDKALLLSAIRKADADSGMHTDLRNCF